MTELLQRALRKVEAAFAVSPSLSRYYVSLDRSSQRR
jgi:hypothetical protein